jgi:hypothetical protein
MTEAEADEMGRSRRRRWTDCCGAQGRCSRSIAVPAETTFVSMRITRTESVARASNPG